VSHTFAMDKIDHSCDVQRITHPGCHQCIRRDSERETGGSVRSPGPTARARPRAAPESPRVAAAPRRHVQVAARTC
jgi:hypothetical protein